MPGGRIPLKHACPWRRYGDEFVRKNETAQCGPTRGRKGDLPKREGGSFRIESAAWKQATAKGKPTPSPIPATSKIEEFAEDGDFLNPPNDLRQRTGSFAGFRLKEGECTLFFLRRHPDRLRGPLARWLNALMDQGPRSMRRINHLV